MKLCGIVAEFNPLTNGHDYFLKEVKKICGCEIAVIMSGNFAQRGEIAILDKFTRAKHAILCGADVVIELPVCFTLSSAPYFANGGVKILSDIGIDSLAFGVKTKDPNILIEIAKLKTNEDSKISAHILSLMKAGQTYSRALTQTYKESFSHLSQEFDEIFSEPNNILAIEYLSEIYKNNLQIEPIFINRQDSGYNQNKIKSTIINGKRKKIVNATFIRRQVESSKFSLTKKLVPDFVFDDLKEFKDSSAKTKLDALIVSTLRKFEQKDLEEFADFNTSLACLVNKNASLFSSIDEISDALQSKCYRRSRIKRLLLIPFFSIKKEFTKILEKPYSINVLAVAKNKKDFISSLKKTSKANLIVSLSDKKKVPESQSEFIRQNQLGTDLYNVCTGKPKQTDKTVFV